MEAPTSVMTVINKGGDGIQMVPQEKPHEKHKRLMLQSKEIIEYVDAFGPLEAMGKFDIKTPQALQKILAKGGRSEEVLVSKRTMYNSPQGYYEGVVQGIIGYVLKMQTRITQYEKLIGDLNNRIQELESQQEHHVELRASREEQGLSCLLALIEEKQ